MNILPSTVTLFFVIPTVHQLILNLKTYLSIEVMQLILSFYLQVGTVPDNALNLNDLLKWMFLHLFSC